VDQVDRARIGISTNGGATFPDNVTITGAVTSNSYWDFAATGIASVAYPSTILLNALTTGNNLTGNSTIIITNIPAQADVRIRISLNSNASERWVVDDLILTGNLVLPIKLVSFTGDLQNNNGLLKWVIGEPEDGGKYEVQRSSDGNNFTTIHTQTGNAEKTEFSYTDISLNSGKNYYRLRMTDIDGKITYSSIINLSGPATGTSVVYPTRVKDRTTLQINDSKLIGTVARLINVGGNVVHSYLIRNSFESIDMSRLPPGLYMLHLANNNVIKVVKD
jgi:hypothetical protein